MVILNQYGMPFHAVMVLGLEQDFLFKSASTYCEYEVFFDYNYFVVGGYGRAVSEFGVNLCQIENPAGRWACNSILFVGMIVGSNIPEIYLTGKVVIEMKKHTNNASILLSKKAFQARKR